MSPSSTSAHYASQKKANLLTPALLKKLPSAQIARRYLHEVLMPQAQSGERFLVICRGAWAWQAPRNLEGKNIAFAYPRGGHFHGGISRRNVQEQNQETKARIFSGAIRLAKDARCFRTSSIS